MAIESKALVEQGFNNCYGQIWSGDIGAVFEVALKGGPWIVRRCDRSAHDGHWRLRIAVDGALDLETDGPLDCGSYLFNGWVEDLTEAGERALAQVSARLTTAGIPHRLELSDQAGNEIRYFCHLWPEHVKAPSVPLWR